MEYRLTPHKLDPDMLEATHTWKKKDGSVKTFLAFVIHTDSLEDDDIKHEIENNGSALVDMLLA